MKTIAVEIAVENYAFVTIQVPKSWDPKRMQQEFSKREVIQSALDHANPEWNMTGEYTVTRVLEAPGAPVDYTFPDEVDQLELLEAA